jgi:hypothetical protein
MPIEEVLRLRDEGTTATLGKVADEAGKASVKIDEVVLGAGKLAAGLLAAGAAAKEALDRLAEARLEVASLSERTGISTETIAGLRLGFERMGYEAGQLESALENLPERMVQASTGAGEVAVAFDKLGVRVNDSEGRLRTADEVLADLVVGLARVDNPAERAGLAMSVLSDAGATLAAVVGDDADALDRMRVAAEQGIDVSEEGIAAARDWKGACAELALALSGLADQLLTTFGGPASTGIRNFTLGLVAAAAGVEAFFTSVRDEVAGLVDDILKQADRLAPIGEALSGRISLGSAFESLSSTPLSAGLALPEGVDLPADSPWAGRGAGGEAGSGTPDRLGDRWRRIVEATESAVEEAARGWLAGVGTTAPGAGASPAMGVAGAVGGGVAGVVSEASAPGDAIVLPDIDTSSVDRAVAAIQGAYASLDAMRERARTTAHAMVDLWAGSLSRIASLFASHAGLTMEQQRGVALFQIAVSTAAGISQAIGHYGPTPVGYIAAGLAAAEGVAQAAFVGRAGLGSAPPSVAGGAGGGGGGGGGGMPSGAVIAGGGGGMGWLGGLLGGLGGIGGIDRRAAGGYVANSGLAVIHQGERIIPPTGGGTQRDRELLNRGGGDREVRVYSDPFVWAPDFIDALNRVLGDSGYRLSFGGR